MEAMDKQKIHCAYILRRQVRLLSHARLWSNQQWITMSQIKGFYRREMLQM